MIYLNKITHRQSVGRYVKKMWLCLKANITIYRVSDDKKN